MSDHEETPLIPQSLLTERLGEGAFISEYRSAHKSYQERVGAAFVLLESLGGVPQYVTQQRSQLQFLKDAHSKRGQEDQALDVKQPKPKRYFPLLDFVRQGIGGYSQMFSSLREGLRFGFRGRRGDQTLNSPNVELRGDTAKGGASS